jgi:hypothetical protein
VIRTEARTPVVALFVGDLVALTWIGIAFLRDGVTFHLAPLIVTVVPAAVVRLDKRPTTSEGVVAVASGMMAAVIATVILAVAGRLDGPSWLPVGDAALEAIVGITVGAAIAIAVAFSGWSPSRSRSSSETGT